MRKQYKAIAIGSPEGFELAEKSIQAAAKGGTWVLLKNIHLAPQWLVQLEKKLHNLTPHNAFRLFMTSEIHPQLPANLLRQSHIFSYEPPPGVKANLQHTFAALPAARYASFNLLFIFFPSLSLTDFFSHPICRMDKHPVERSRLYFLLAWFHAVIQERLRYIPIGWTKIFEFNDAVCFPSLCFPSRLSPPSFTLSCSFSSLPSLRSLSNATKIRTSTNRASSQYSRVLHVLIFDLHARGRSIPPEKIPWVALRTILGQTIYGGRVDNEFDMRLLTSFLEQLFTPNSLYVTRVSKEK
jgi:dynein heavy chain 1, cytosolic